MEVACLRNMDGHLAWSEDNGHRNIHMGKFGVSISIPFVGEIVEWWKQEAGAQDMTPKGSYFSHPPRLAVVGCEVHTWR